MINLDKMQLKAGGPDINPFDLFNDIFGGGAGGVNMSQDNMFQGGMFNMFSEKQRKPKNRVERITVSLEDIYKSKTLKISYKKKCICPSCDGTGGKYSSSIIRCSSCEGKGRIIKIVQIGPGMISQTTQPCYKCNGKGKIIKPGEICTKCLEINMLIKIQIEINLNKSVKDE